MPLHPDLQAFLELVNAQPKPLAEGSVEQARQSYEASSQFIDDYNDRLTKTIEFTAQDGEALQIRQYGENQDTVAHVILFFHGGGYVLGSLDSHNTFCHRLADHCHCQVFAVDYRLAPEYKFPTAFKDACDAYQWLTRNIRAEKNSSKDIIVVGDSVGATLATNVCIEAKAQLRDNNTDKGAGISWQIPSKQILLYPCTSSYQNTRSHSQYGKGYLLEFQTLQWMFKQYLTVEQQRNNWQFAPLQQSDLSDLPPALIILPEFDPLLDEGQMYAKKLAEANVAVKTQVFKGMTHDFARLGNIVPDTVDDLMTEIGQFTLN